MPRFFVPQPLSVGASVILPEAVAHHLHVVRSAPGDALTLFNGEGGEYAATLTTLERRRAQAEVQDFSPREAELPYALTLAQALPEGSKMDWIIEKAVELGAATIQPLAARRSVVRLSTERAEKKLSHWQGIVVAASEQCGRNRLARVAEPAAFADWIVEGEPHIRILLSPRAGQSLAEWALGHPPQPLSLLIGPEGGFTAEEEHMALAQGVLALSMGTRVLRTETAGMVAIAALNAIWGQF